MIESVGYKLVRFTATDVLHRLDGVAAVLLEAVGR